MEELHGGRRAEARRGLPRWPFILGAALISALLLGYFALCAYVAQSGTILPNTVVRGIPVGGLTADEAAEHLRGAAFAQGEAELVYPNGERFRIPADVVGLWDPDGAANEAYRRGRSRGFAGGGLALLTAPMRAYSVPAPLAFRAEGVRMLNNVFTVLEKTVVRPVQETTWRVMEHTLLVEKGMEGGTIDRAAIERALLTAFESPDNRTVLVEVQETAPRPTDFSAIAEEIFRSPSDAALDPGTFEIAPGILGLSLDVERAEQLFALAGDGSNCVIPLTVTSPNVTTEELTAKLFRDVLGEYTSSVSGTSNRISNVNLAAQACHEMILLPGQVFSYNTATGSRSAAKGYLPAPAYVGGLSVDEIGGGICQVSSTIYAAALRANLKMVERANHMYAVGYVPDGQDATVYFGALDFRFENNTSYPIKLLSVMTNRRLTVQLLGTRTDNLYVVMEGKTTSTTPYTTVYRPDESVTPGAAVESITPYTGRRVEAYRCIYDNSGTPDDRSDDVLISRTLESVNNYRHRDRVYLFHPVDAGWMGLDPLTGKPAVPPAGGETPPPDPQPSESVAPPEESEPPVTEEPPEESEPPAASESPAASEPPAPEPPSGIVEPPAGEGEGAEEIAILPPDPIAAP